MSAKNASEEGFGKGIEEGPEIKEGMVGNSFRRGFGFVLGGGVALMVLALFFALLTYLAVSAGLITWNDVFQLS